jgi:hypothetical protein
MDQKRLQSLRSKLRLRLGRRLESFLVFEAVRIGEFTTPLVSIVRKSCRSRYESERSRLRLSVNAELRRKAGRRRSAAQTIAPSGLIAALGDTRAPVVAAQRDRMVPSADVPSVHRLWAGRHR